MSAGDDLKAGRSVGGEGTTELVGQGKGVSDFSGSVIFLVKPFPIGGGGGHVPPGHDVAAIRGEGIFAGEGLVGQGGDTNLPVPIGGTGISGTGGQGAIGGIGVLGRGGKPVSAGVVGVAAGHPMPLPAKIAARGVYGAGATGVHGEGATGPGIFGESTNNRGGVFTSTGVSAQLRLAPHEKEPVPKLPKSGQAGDLLVSSNPEGHAELFFCVQGNPQANPALWARVQLITPFVPGNS